MKPIKLVAMIILVLLIGCGQNPVIEIETSEKEKVMNPIVDILGACIYEGDSILQCVANVTYDECVSLDGSWHEGIECPNIYQPPPGN